MVIFRLDFQIPLLHVFFFSSCERVYHLISICIYAFVELNTVEFSNIQINQFFILKSQIHCDSCRHKEPIRCRQMNDMKQKKSIHGERENIYSKIVWWRNKIVKGKREWERENRVWAHWIFIVGKWVTQLSILKSIKWIHQDGIE